MLDTPVGMLLGEFLVSLEKRILDSTAGDATAIEAALRALVACVVNQSAAGLSDAYPQTAVPPLEKTGRVVEAESPFAQPRNLHAMR